MFQNSPVWLDHHGGVIDIVDSRFWRNKPSIYPTFYTDGEDLTNVAFLNCTFINASDPTILGTAQNDGLYIVDAGFIAIGTTFERFNRALVFTTILDAPNSAFINNSTFRENFVSIKGSVMSGLQIMNSEFVIRKYWDALTQAHSGIELSSCVDYVVTGNHFTGSSVSNSIHEGLTISEGGPDFEQVSNNDFTNLGEAIIAKGQNRDNATDGATGLEFVCNNMAFGSIFITDFRIDDDGVQRSQGNSEVGAGNNFSFGNTTDSESSIRMNTTSDMDYFRRINGLQNDPELIDPSQVFVFNALNNPACFEAKSGEAGSEPGLFNLITRCAKLKDAITDIISSGGEAPRELINELRTLNVGVKEVINDRSISLSAEEIETYWTHYKTSQVAQRKALIDGYQIENADLASKVELIASTAAGIYTDPKDEALLARITSNIEDEEAWEQEIYRNILVKLNLLNFVKSDSRIHSDL